MSKGFKKRGIVSLGLLLFVSVSFVVHYYSTDDVIESIVQTGTYNTGMTAGELYDVEMYWKQEKSNHISKMNLFMIEGERRLGELDSIIVDIRSMRNAKSITSYPEKVFQSEQSTLLKLVNETKVVETLTGEKAGLEATN